MSALAKRIKRAPDLATVYNCLDEMQALIALAGKRIKELEAKEVERQLADGMLPEINDIG